MDKSNGAHMALDIEVLNTANALKDGEKDYRRGKTFGTAGMTITVQDLTYSVPSNQVKNERAVLLKGVTGAFYPGQMSALMGPSGSGKTTLLDLLAGRKTTGKTEGSILFACNKPSTQFLRRYTGYVEQFDTLLHILTVEEMLMYTAELKRPRQEPLEDKKAAVQDVLEKLALVSCRNVKIGNALNKGISGGQAKRTNIGISLITNPRVLFLDEPTSGLDSYTSNEVITVVQALTRENVTIVATIHSPTQYCFSLFDSLMMLVRGSVVYYGDRSSATSYVKSLPFSHLLDKEEQYNDAEFLVDLFTKADREGKAAEFVTAYQQSSLKEKADLAVQTCLKDKHVLPESVQKELAVKRATVTPSWWALRTLIKYRTAKNYRDPEFLGPRVADKLLIGIIVMTLYLGIGNDFKVKNFMNISAVLFMFTTLPAFGAAAYVPSIVLERALFTRERSDGLYRVSTYLAAKMFDELTMAALVSVVVAAIVFAGVQLQGSFLLFWLSYYTTLCTGIVLAYFIAAMSPNMDVANAALPTYIVTLLFFAGFLINLNDIPVWWEWYSYINFLRYAWSALMANQFNAKNPIWMEGKTVLHYYGLEDVNMWGCWGIQIAFFVFFTICAWAALSFKRHSKR